MQTFTGIQYLKIDIASNYGLDKSTWDERIDWFDKHETQLAELVNSAAEPALYFASLQAYEAAKSGAPSGYPISLDATSSGLQLLACLTGDRKAAQLCNVINYIEDGVIQRRDGYTVIYNEMNDRIQETGRIQRNDVKKAVMTALYGSKAQPKRVFGEGGLLYTFYDTMEELAPAAWELNENMPMFWQQTKCHSWTMPDNFHVHVKVMDQRTDTVHFLNTPYEVHRQVNEPTEQGRSLGANTIHSTDGYIVREMNRRCNYDWIKVSRISDWLSEKPVDPEPGNQLDFEMAQTLWAHYMRTGVLSARILDHLDAWNIGYYDAQVLKDLIQSLPAKPFQIVSIHDCFRCLPNYGDDMRKQYNLQLQAIAKSDLLSAMLSEITGRHVAVTKVDPNMWIDIADAEYALS